MKVRKTSLLFLLLGSAALYLIDPFVRISDKNLLPSDICFTASALILFLDFRAFLCWERELLKYPGFVPFVLYLAAATIGFTVTALRTRAVAEFHIFSLLQLGFILACLCPTVLASKTNDSAVRMLWSIPMWSIPLAGVLSLTDVLGLTNLGMQTDSRHYNVILQANGFILFAAVSPFLLQRMFPFRRTTIVYISLWAAGCAGLILSGSKAGIIVVALSIIVVMYINLKDIVSDKAYFIASVVLLFVVVGSTAGVLSVMPNAFGRFQQMLDFMQTGADDSSASLRQDQLTIVLRDLREKPVLWLGTGLKQYRVLHPEDGIESIHNMYLQQLYETGIVGLAAFVAIFILCLRKCAQCYLSARQSGSSEMAKHWACCFFAIAGYLLMGLVYPLGYDRQFWLLLVMATPSYLELQSLRLQNRSSFVLATL